MRGSLQLLAPAALAVALAFAALPARAGGTITTTGSSIATGTAPVKGTVTVDPSAPPVAAPTLPSVDPLGSIGSISGQIPAFVAAGGGAAFVATPPTQTLAGGVYSYSTYNVPQGTTLTYTGAVTIQTSGDAQIDGLVTTTTPGASVTFVCGGNFRIISHAGAFTTGVSTTGLSSPIVVDANFAITTSTADTSSSWIDAVSGPVTLRAHTTGTLLALASITVRSRSAGNTLVQSSGSVALPGAATVRADTGDVTVQAYGGPVIVQSSALTAGNNLIVEASGNLNAAQGAALSGQNSVTVTAFGGNARVTGASSVSQTGGTGDVAVRASDAVNVSGASTIQDTGTGDVSLTAFGGGVSIEAAGSSSGSTVRNSSGPPRDVNLRASGDVVVAGTSQVTSGNGSVTLRSTTGSISLLGDAAVNAPGGTIDARAAADVTSLADAALSASLFPSLAGQTLLVRAGAAGIALTADPISTPGGALTLISSGTIDVSTKLAANGTLTIQSTQGNVDVSDETLATGPAGGRSGDILIESYGGSAATIDATNATVRSGDDANASGNVTLQVYATAAVVAQGSLVPQQVKVRLKKKDLAQSRLTASGVLDTGPDAIDLTGDATLTVGTLTFPVTLAADAAGRPSFRGTGVSVRLTPSKVGSSRTAFAFDVTGDFRGILDAAATGELAFAFAHGALDARGTVRLESGIFVKSRRRAALVLPTLYVASARATLKSGGKDRLDLVAGFATDGTTPSTAPDVTVVFGNAFKVTVPSAAFKPAGTGRFAATDAARGVQSLVIDYRSETITFHGRNLTLGTPTPGLVISMRAGVTLGTDARGADIRVAHRGTSLVY